MHPNQPTQAELQAAVKSTPFRWPATVSLAAVVVCGLNLVLDGSSGMSIGNIRFRLAAAFCIFAALLVATLPVWIHAGRRVLRGLAPPSLPRQAGSALGLLFLALMLLPEFSVAYREYQTWDERERKDVTTEWVKRSVLASVRMPFVELDELAWLQQNYSAAYIPAKVFCPLRSTRLVPLFGVVRFNYEANALAAGDEDPPAAVVANTIARCEREGRAMLARGLTKESALMRGDVERFFALNALERDDSSLSSNTAIVLEDAAIPKELLAKIDATLAAAPEHASVPYMDSADTESAGQVRERSALLVDTLYATQPGRVRRLRPLALAVALGRPADIARLEARD